MKVAVSSPSFSSHPVLIKTIHEAFPDVRLNSEGKVFTKEEFIAFVEDREAIIVGLDTVTRDVIDALPHLKIVSKYGVGLDNIDVDYCKVKNIAIGWTGGVNRLSVAEMCLGNMLSLMRNLSPSSKLLASGLWVKQGGEQLSGKRVGIIGLGNIGKELVRLLKPFHCDIWVNDIEYDHDFIQENNLSIKEKEEIYSSCKIISLHTPLTRETNRLIGKDQLNLMQDRTILINSARGGLVVESDLIEELRTGRISAALDVFESEPPTDLEFLGFTNLISTPHIGGNSLEAVEAMGMSAINHLKNFAR